MFEKSSHPNVPYEDFYHALVSIRIFHALFHVFSNRVRVSLLTLRILLMFGGKKGHDLFHNLFSRLYWTATFSQPKTDKIKHIYKAFGQHKNLPNKHKNSPRIKQSKKNPTKSLFNTQKIPQNLSLIFRLFSFLFAVSLSILRKTLHFS